MKIGKINIKNPVILAPMHDVADTAFRLISKKLGADIVFSEFVSSEALIRSIPKAIKSIQILKEERPFGIQIFGSDANAMAKSIAVIEKIKPDFIDINCGCWVKNVVSRGEGAGLLRDIKKLEVIVKAIVASTKIPVTLKARLGWDHNNIVILDLAKMVEELGVKALTVHCRTRSQGYQGKADWTWLEKIRKVIKIPLIGNGDILSPQDASKLFSMGCDGVMIGRGAITNPWIFNQIKHFLKTGKDLPHPSLSEKIKICIEHLETAVNLKGERNAIYPFRKYYVGYLKGTVGIAKLRADLMQLTTFEDVKNRLLVFLKESETHEIL